MLHFFSTSTREILGSLTTRISPYFCIVLLTCVTPRPSVADRVTLDDGRVLEGTIALLPGISVDPRSNEDVGSTVVMCDNGLTRTFISKKRIIGAAEESGNQSEEEINVFQRVPDSGRSLSSIGTVVSSTPFDDFGRRVITLSTPGGLLDHVQGITKITPHWISVEGLITEHPLRLDMRIATSSVPRETLRRIVEKQVDAEDVDERLQFVRLLIQSARYKEAGDELRRVIQDFPSLKSLRSQQNNIANLAANQLLEEIILRQRSGQDRLVLTLLENFSSTDGNGELLQAVKELRDEYRQRLDQANSLVGQIQKLTEHLPDTRDRQLAENVVQQISTELTFESLRRLSVYQRIGADGQLPPEQALSLAITGWLGGADFSQINLKLAISTANVSDLLSQYLVSKQPEKRLEIRQQLNAEEAFDSKTVAAVAAHMVRPAAPSDVRDDGFFNIELPIPPREVENNVPRRCLVQLPPEYDARRRYPVIISLHSASTTPLQQIEWWAGAPTAAGRREGQAARHGTIIVAPEWANKTQVGYRYSAEEHSVVLSALREVSRQFSVDSDRAYLSGHSMGGDAAWDIGLAHPDLWAGIISVSGKAGRYVHHYHQNAKQLPIYIVCGGLDHNTFSTNEMDLDRYLKKGFDLTYVEYRGRGHEHFSDELLKIFDWTSRRTRPKFPKEIDAVSMRPWDRLFWWIEMNSPPQRTMVMPSDWPPAQFGRPFTLSAKVTASNRVTARCGAEEVRVWLSPEIVDFQRPVTINLGTRRIHQGDISPDIDTLLEDLRSRCDYQHPFWAVVTKNPPPAQ